MTKTAKFNYEEAAIAAGWAKTWDGRWHDNKDNESERTYCKDAEECVWRSSVLAAIELRKKGIK